MNFFNNISFAQPLLLWLLVVIPFLIAGYIFRNNWGEIKISSLDNLSNIGKSFKEYMKHFMFALKLIALSLLIVALARPQSKTSWKNIQPKRGFLVTVWWVLTRMIFIYKARVCICRHFLPVGNYAVRFWL